MTARVKAEALSTTYTTEQYALGTEFVEHPDEVAANLTGVSDTFTSSNWLGTGPRTWVFVRAAEAVAAGVLCEFDSDTYTTAYSVEPCDEDAKAPHQLAGVADHAIAAASYGWIIKKGCCVCLTSAGTAIGHALDSDGSSGTEGSVDTAAAATISIGVALEAVSAVVTNYAQIRISLP